jgi:hypothetical protein
VEDVIAKTEDLPVITGHVRNTRDIGAHALEQCGDAPCLPFHIVTTPASS